MAEYAQLPTQKQWLKDMQQTGARGLLHTKYTQAERVGELLANIETMNSRVKLERIESLAHIQVQVGFLCKWHDRADKLGKAALSKSQWAHADALKRCVEKLLAELLDDDFKPFKDRLDAFLSKEVGAHEKADDDARVLRGEMDWIDELKRKALKLSFRGGLAYRKHVDGGKIMDQPYDTQDYGDVLEQLNTSLYVMDDRGRIYVSGKATHDLKHSSFLQGNPTKAAGTMRWEKGRLTILTNQSGHYKPGLRQMLTVLERLRAYQVDLTRTTFYRCNLSRAWEKAQTSRGGRPLILEPCNAAEMLQKRCFARPGAYAPMSLCITADGGEEGTAVL